MAPAADQRETSGRRDSSRRRELVGVGVFVVRGDDDESADARALRELEEATGLRAVNPRSVGESEDVFPEGLQYRTIFVRVDWAGGEPALREPGAHARWSWFRCDDAPEPLLLPVASLRAKGFRP